MIGEVLNGLPHGGRPGCSGARLFLIPTQGCDLGAQLVGALLIAAGESYGEGEFQLLELVITFLLGVAA
jgi:hypothetical protein